MIDDFGSMVAVASLAFIKVLFSLFLALALKLNGPEIFLSIFIGGMAGVLAFGFFGARIRHFISMRNRKKNKRINFKRVRTLLKIWRRFGLWGIAALTPPIITPPIGAILAVAFGERLNRILLYMSISFGVWCTIFALFGNAIKNIFDRIF